MVRAKEYLLYPVRLMGASGKQMRRKSEIDSKPKLHVTEAVLTQHRAVVAESGER